MVNTTKFVEAYKTFKRSVESATLFHDQKYTNSAITRERYERLMKARVALAEQIPAAPEGDPDVAIQDVLAKLAPKNADDVALQETEWRKVQTLIDAGRSLEAIILSASPLRLAAIAQWIEVSPEALASTDPEGVVAEVNALVFDQLVKAGVPEAVRAGDVVGETAVLAAWRDVLTEALEGAASLGALSALARVDIEGYRALGIEQTLERDVETRLPGEEAG